MATIAALPNTVSTMTLGADPIHRHVIDSMAWSYSGVPSGGGLQVTDAGATIFDLDITVAGGNTVLFRNGLGSIALGNALVVTLDAGGIGVTGKLNVEWHDENT